MSPLVSSPTLPISAILPACTLAGRVSSLSRQMALLLYAGLLGFDIFSLFFCDFKILFSVVTVTALEL